MSFTKKENWQIWDLTENRTKYLIMSALEMRGDGNSPVLLESVDDLTIQEVIWELEMNLAILLKCERKMPCGEGLVDAKKTREYIEQVLGVIKTSVEAWVEKENNGVFNR